ncbi:MAG: lyase family protein [Patescibacteria group bacterium]|jgi:adenylosuccinate lyase
MIKRYQKQKIEEIFNEPRKYLLWEMTEKMLLRARVELGILQDKIYRRIIGIWGKHPIDISYLHELEKRLKHDLNSFLGERNRHLDEDDAAKVHEDITSYDTEESAFIRMLKDAVAEVKKEVEITFNILGTMAVKYKYTVMYAHTHGQGAKLQSFGKRCLGWREQLAIDLRLLSFIEHYLNFSKMSGAVGNYGNIDPELEKLTLGYLGFKPFYGATQIMPREIYAMLASALCQLIFTLEKISLDIRLGARSGRPIYQEPFNKEQMGSSAMPHKRNTISTEQMEGMSRLGMGCFIAILQNIRTWEERAIEQSCVERVAWPDLFHIVIHCLETMNKVLSGLDVHQENMLMEIVESRGCYASDEAKEFIKKKAVALGLTAEECYRIVQLAAFNVLEPDQLMKEYKTMTLKDLTQADQWLERFKNTACDCGMTIETKILTASLATHELLKASEADVAKWNQALAKIFSDESCKAEWKKLFSPSFLLRNEAFLYQEILKE